LSAANNDPAVTGCATTRTPTVPAPKELNSIVHSAPVKRSASCGGALTVDDAHQPYTSHQSSTASAAIGSATDPR